MRRAIVPISAAWIAVWRRNYLVWRKLAAESMLGDVVEPLFYIAGFGVGFGAMLPQVEGVSYVAYLAGGMVCYSTMMSASFEVLYSGFTRMHVQRTWEGILNAPVALDDVVFAEWIWGATKSVLPGMAVLLVALALGLVHSWTAALILPVVLLVGLCFSGLGLVVVALAKSYDFFQYWFTLALMPMMLLSGVFYPVANMPRWLQGLAQALPLTHGVELGRPLLLGQWPAAPFLNLAALAAYAIAGYAVSMRLLRRRLLR
ncbi:MAG TPA: ABC transporter permease [Usitatibacter sp.]|nr:ABC transporter permease [Usitatibacter sp.]